eukprot:2564840-Pyramimonas_sp.AAC.1
MWAAPRDGSWPRPPRGPRLRGGALAASSPRSGSTPPSPRSRTARSWASPQRPFSTRGARTSRPLRGRSLAAVSPQPWPSS